MPLKVLVQLPSPSVKAATGRSMSMPRWVKGADDTKHLNRQSDVFNQTRISPPWIWFGYTALHWAWSIRWSQERRKTSRGNEKIRPPCRNTLYWHPSPQRNPKLWLNSVSVERNNRQSFLFKKKKKKNNHMFQSDAARQTMCGRG